MKKNYIFHSTCFDKGDLQKKMIVLKDNSIDFDVENKTNHGSFKAPLSVLIEVDLLIEENDFERANELLANIKE